MNLGYVTSLCIGYLKGLIICIFAVCIYATLGDSEVIFIVRCGVFASDFGAKSSEAGSAHRLFVVNIGAKLKMY